MSAPTNDAIPLSADLERVRIGQVELINEQTTTLQEVFTGVARRRSEDPNEPIPETLIKEIASLYTHIGVYNEAFRATHPLRSKPLGWFFGTVLPQVRVQGVFNPENILGVMQNALELALTVTMLERRAEGWLVKREDWNVATGNESEALTKARQQLRATRRKLKEVRQDRFKQNHRATRSSVPTKEQEETSYRAAVAAALALVARLETSENGFISVPSEQEDELHSIIGAIPPNAAIADRKLATLRTLVPIQPGESNLALAEIEKELKENPVKTGSTNSNLAPTCGTSEQ